MHSQARFVSLKLNKHAPFCYDCDIGKYVEDQESCFSEPQFHLTGIDCLIPHCMILDTQQALMKLRLQSHEHA
jgi:hypothetical protein